jgi:hypothetical protein
MTRWPTNCSEVRLDRAEGVEGEGGQHEQADVERDRGVAASDRVVDDHLRVPGRQHAQRGDREDEKQRAAGRPPVGLTNWNGRTRIAQLSLRAFSLDALE